MSAILKEMSERLLRNADGVRSSEAAHITLMFASIAWDETVGLGHRREGYRSAWEIIEAENPEVWNELKSNDVDAMIDELVRFKQQHHPEDRRRILACGMPNGRVHIEWLPAAAPGVDSRWEMRLYGLVRANKWERAIQFLQETRRISRNEAARQVVAIAAEVGIG